jgi:hypothetical protein
VGTLAEAEFPQNHLTIGEIMMVTDSALKVAPPDVKSLLRQYREVVVPAAAEFLEADISASRLRDRWRPYYFDTFHSYDLTVEQAWRQASRSQGLLETGNPSADPKFEIPLMHFPVSVAHNNLDRLIEVLAIELGNRTVDETSLRERKVDFAHMIDRLDALMAFLAEDR